jgi:hypothetical protein
VQRVGPSRRSARRNDQLYHIPGFHHDFLADRQPRPPIGSQKRGPSLANM